MTETKRDLHADLELCERGTRGPWKVRVGNHVFCDAVLDAEGNELFCSETATLEDLKVGAEAREGWPHALKRAIEAEKRVEELECEVERLRNRNKRLHDEVKRAHECSVLANKDLTAVIEENERLRFALGWISSYYNKIVREDNVPVEMVFEITQIAKKALEGKE
ncbi:hypothetical protein BSNK01_12220 [Bacillaceae bacterium]